MRNRQYIASGPVGAPIITEQMDDHFVESYISFEFYDDNGGAIPLKDLYVPANRVTPGAGTATFTGSEDGFDEGTITNGSDVDVTDPDYPRMNFLGAVRYITMTPVIAITVATHMRMKVTRR